MNEIIFENEMKRRDRIDKIHFMLHFVSLLVIMIISLTFVAYISQYDVVSYDNPSGSLNVNMGTQGDIDVQTNG